MKRARFLSLFCLIFCLLGAHALAEDTRQYEQYTYTLMGDGTVMIVDYDWTKSSGDVYIPALLDSYPVSIIGEQAFAAGEDEIREDGTYVRMESVYVHLPEGIREIEEKAFFNAPVNGINIPGSVRKIGAGAFAGCWVQQFTLDGKHDLFASIDGALYDKAAKTLIAYPQARHDVIVPEGIVSIGDYACYGCELGNLFDGPGIADILPQSLQSIGKYAFSTARIIGSEQNKKWKLLPPSVRLIDDYAFYQASYDMRSESLPTLFDLVGLERVGDYAFAEMRLFSVSSFYLGNGTAYIEAETIGDHAFYQFCKCTGYEQIYLSVTASAIGDYAFAVDNTIHDKTNRYYILHLAGDAPGMGHYCFDGVPVVSEIYYNSEEYHREGKLLTIPGTLKTVPAHAFAQSSDWNLFTYVCIEELVLENGVEAIQEGAFENNYQLKSVQLPDTLKTIGAQAFAGCPRLKEITLPASVESIGKDAFNRTVTKLNVVSGSYAEQWAKENGFNYAVIGAEADDLDWLN